MADDDKDKAVSKPKEPPKPVQLGGESLLDRVIPHLKKIIIGGILLAVFIGGFFQVRNCKRAKQERATERLVKVLELGDQPLAETGTPPDPVKNPGFANEKERAEKLLQEMTGQGAEPGPGVHASLLLDAGRVDDAIAAYRGCQVADGLDGVLCREGLGIALETKGLAEKDAAAKQKLLEEALEVFGRMQPAEDGPRRAYAIYHQGRIQLLLGKIAEGKQLLQKAKDSAPPADLEQVIELRLLSLEAA